MITKGRKLGEGVYSKVYHVKTSETEEFAFKICLKDESHDFGWSYKEMDISYRLRHPNLIYMHDVSIGVPFDAPLSPLQNIHSGMELDLIHMKYELAKCSLFDYIEKRAITMFEFQSFMCDVLLGLEHLHSMGYMHRDIRADNILIFDEGDGVLTAKLSDYGFVKKYYKHDTLSPRVNNRNYRPPECFEKEVNYDLSFDVWSLGCTMYNIVQRKSFMDNSRPDLPEHNKTAIFNNIPKIAGGRSSLQWEEFFPLSEQDQQDIQIFSNSNELKTLVFGMLQCNREKRLSASQCLDLPFFNSLRDQITETRKMNPIPVEEEKRYHIDDCQERKEAYKMFRYIIENKTNYDWYTHKTLFLALSFVDRSLSKISQRKKKLIPTAYSGHYFTNKHSSVFRLVCLYLSIKYLFSTSFRAISFQEIFGKSYSEEVLEFASNLEITIVTNYLEYKLYEKSLYDRLMEDRVPTKDDTISLFIFMANKHHHGRTLEEAYKLWEKNKKRFIPK